MSRNRFRRAACRRAARGAGGFGAVQPDERKLPKDHPNPADGALLSSKAQGMRTLTYIRHSDTRFAAAVQQRLDSTVDPGDENRLLEEHPGPKSPVTAEVMFVAILLCAQILRSCRRTDLSRVLAGLHRDVAREVGLLGPDGELVVPSYKSLCRQLTRFQDALRGGWTVVEREGQPGEKRVRYDLEWLIVAMVKASIPRSERRKIQHIVVDATSVRSWGTWLPGIKKKDVDSDPLATWTKESLETDAEEPDLEALRRAAEEDNEGRNVRFGPDNRRIYGTDDDSRIGHKSRNSEGPAGFIMGFELTVGVAAPVVGFNGNLNKVTLDPAVPWVCTMSFDPAGSNPGPIAARLILAAREIFPRLREVTADRGFTTKRESFLRPLHEQGINVTMDYRKDVIARPTLLELGKRGERAWMHAGTLLSEHTREALLVPPEELRAEEKWWGRDDELSAEEHEEAAEREDALTEWYQDRARMWRWSVKRRLPGGNIQFRSPVAAGRAATSAATVAAGSYTVPLLDEGHDTRATVTGLLAQLDQWQRIPYGTGAWHKAYHTARAVVEGTIGKVKAKGGLARGTCQSMGLEANALAALALVVTYNLHKQASIAAEGDGDDRCDHESGDPPQPAHHDRAPRNLPAPSRAPP